MYAYVKLIQEKEKEIKCDVFTHQKWSGASYSDRVLNGASMSSLFLSVPPSFEGRD
jgi:isocitrate lyase